MNKLIFCAFICVLISAVLCNEDHHVPNKQELREDEKELKVMSKGGGKIVVAVVPKDSEIGHQDDNSGLKVKHTKEGIKLVKDGHIHDLDETDRRE